MAMPLKTGFFQCVLLRKVFMQLFFLCILASSKVAHCQPPSKTVRLFSSADAGFVNIASPTISEIDSRTVIFFTLAKKNLKTHKYNHFAEIPFIVVFVRTADSGANGEGHVGIFQPGVFLFRGKVEIASDSINFEYSIAQIESEREVAIQDYLSVSLVRDTTALLDESLDLDNGRVLVVDLRDGENMRVYQKNTEPPSTELLEGVWNPEKEQPLRRWVQTVIKETVRT